LANEELVGGLYGIDLGHVFWGKVFFKVSNASKVAFITANRLKKRKLQAIDCQVYNPHLESLGCRN
jgi:leucyl/phenylalanyl-tRNA--protein transferase